MDAVSLKMVNSSYSSLQGPRRYGAEVEETRSNPLSSQERGRIVRGHGRYDVPPSYRGSRAVSAGQSPFCRASLGLVDGLMRTTTNGRNDVPTEATPLSPRRSSLEPTPQTIADDDGEAALAPDDWLEVMNVMLDA